jgi:hypothetical protein
VDQITPRRTRGMDGKERGAGAGRRRDGPRHRRAVEDAVTGKEGGTGGRKNQAPRKGVRMKNEVGVREGRGGSGGLGASRRQVRQAEWRDEPRG